MLPECASVCFCVWPQTFCQCASVRFSSFCNRIIRFTFCLCKYLSSRFPTLHHCFTGLERRWRQSQQSWGKTGVHGCSSFSRPWKYYHHIYLPMILPYFRCGINRNNDFPGSRTSHLMILSYSPGVNGLSALSKVRLRTTMSPCGTSRGINSAWEHLLFSKPTPRLTIK